jgi:hypothetical protein
MKNYADIASTSVVHRLEAYREFLKKKIAIAHTSGLEVAPSEINPILKPHQRDIVCWAIRMGSAALFESFGLGKTFQQLEVIRIILSKVGGKGLIVMPLGSPREFRRDAATLGILIKFIRSTEELEGNGIYLTNYETIREGKLDLSAFTAASLDEAAVLRSSGSKTFGEIPFGP